MQTNVRKMLLDNDLCVLCTSKNDVPDASLMLYDCDERCTKLYMLTLRETAKYQNIVNNSNVSVLIDTRDTTDDKTTQIKALTIHGEAFIVEDKDTSGKLIDRMVSKHDKLSNLAADNSVCVIEVLMKRIIFLENVDKVSNVSLNGK